MWANRFGRLTAIRFPSEHNEKESLASALMAQLLQRVGHERLFDLYDLGIVGQKFIALNEPATWGVTLGWSF